MENAAWGFRSGRGAYGTVECDVGAGVVITSAGLETEGSGRLDTGGARSSASSSSSSESRDMTIGGADSARFCTTVGVAVANWMVESALRMISSSFGNILRTSSKYSSIMRLVNASGRLHLGQSQVLMFRFAVRNTERSKHPQWVQVEPRAGTDIREKVCGSFKVTLSKDTNSFCA